MRWARRTGNHNIEAAHLVHEDGRPAGDCHSANLPAGEPSAIATADGQFPPRKPLVPLAPEHVSPQGLPYGKVCTWCLRRVWRHNAKT